MSVTRTPTIETNTEFEAIVPVTKSFVDAKTGKRYVSGVATGVAEDRDGERCSKSCVLGMAKQIEAGDVKVTSSHQQDWMSEIGEVETYKYHPDTDELEVVGVLPPEGVDAIADKAWREAQKPHSRLGWSIGGKLLKSYFERNEVGKRRKVLDAIQLKHVMLTKNPAYSGSFASAVVAKTTLDPPADDAFTTDAEPLEPIGEVVAKDTTGSWVSGSSDGGGGRDSRGSGQRNAGERPNAKRPNTEDDGSDDDEQRDLPKAPSERHLACPNCGHEFAADLPVSPDDQQGDDTNDKDDDQDKETGKSTTTESHMPKLDDALASLKALAGTEVTKADDAAEGDVTKAATTDPAPSDTERLIAASHIEVTKSLSGLEERSAEAFGLVAKALGELREAVAELPKGRKSVARVLPDSTGHEKASVTKTVQQRVDEADGPVEALKVLNEENWGVPAQ